MTAILADSNVVVVANDVNMSIFKPPWLANSGILREEELRGEVVVSPVILRVPTSSFELIVVPNRMQLVFRGPACGSIADIERILGGIIRTLPHTPYTGCGLNFNYLATVPQHEFRDWCQRSFSSEAARTMHATSAEDARFGSYFSYNTLGGRAKLDIKPTKTTGDTARFFKGWDEGMEVMRLNFNYHFDAEGATSRSEAVLESLKKWEDASTHCQALVDSLPQ